MRLVVWNCNMALHRKGEALRALQPDIAVLPEAACPAILTRKGLRLSGLGTAWATKEGGNENKGLLVVGFGDYEVSAIEDRAPLDVFLPVRVRGRHTFDLLAVWSFNHRSAGTDFPIGAALDHYADMIAGGALVAGDLTTTSGGTSRPEGGTSPPASIGLRVLGTGRSITTREGRRSARRRRRRSTGVTGPRTGRATTSTTSSNPPPGALPGRPSERAALMSGSARSSAITSLWSATGTTRRSTRP